MQTIIRTNSEPSARQKIKGIEELAAVVTQLRAEDSKVVLCHGVFDPLHIGHIRHFEQAKKHGDVLVVTVTPDRFVNKGPHRRFSLNRSEPRLLLPSQSSILWP